MWKDKTSYSQGDKVREPKTWTLAKDGLRVTVTKGHIYYKGQWVMHCGELGIDTMLILQDGSEVEAQKMAVAYAQKRARRLLSAAENLEA